MIPHKAKNLTKDIAEELNISKTLVDDLIEFYYKDVRENLSELNHPRINIEGLGQFVIRANGVNKAIPKYEKALNTHDTSTFTAYYNKKIIEDRLELLKKMQSMLELEEQKKKEFKSKKYEKYFKTNLAEPETDNRGDN